MEGVEIYKPLIDDIVWSYSNLETFSDCRYRWYLKYIARCKDVDMFYASYGSFIHRILERYYKGQLKKEDMLDEFVLNFKSEVRGDRPSANVVSKYISEGIEYFKNFEPLPFDVIDVEKKVNFQRNGRNFIGFIDIIAKDTDGGIVVVDHKSRALKKRSMREKPTLKDKELDKMMRQLYIYSAAIFDEYGVYPSKLCFNCFRNNTLIEEAFDISAYKSTWEWAFSIIDEIETVNDFPPCIDYFPCNFICGLRDECCYKE